MKLDIRRIAAALAMMLVLTATSVAQGQTTKPLTPLKVVIVISKYDGDRKISSFPYTLVVTANDPHVVNLRMGSQIPLPQEYGGMMNVGMNIDCSAVSTDDGRFKVEVRIEDSSVMERRSSDIAPTLRSFVASNSIVLRDGQSTQFSAGADKTTGEVVRVDLTMTVEK